jgi:hypothetical protein
MMRMAKDDRATGCVDFDKSHDTNRVVGWDVPRHRVLFQTRTKGHAAIVVLVCVSE